MSKVKQKIKRILSRRPVIANISISQTEGRLSGKTAFVTGATSGIGLEIAKRYKSEGAVVHVAGRNALKLKELEKEGYIAHQLDVREIESIVSVMNEVFSVQPPSVLVNSAGIYRYPSFLECTEEVWDEVLDSNLKGTFFVTQQFCKHLLPSGREGSIINIASNTGVLGAWSCYGASKHGVCGLTEGLGKELLSKGVTVNTIAPGPVATPINGRTSEDDIEYSFSSNGRMAVVEEVAELAVWLASPSLRHMTGQTIAYDGGESCSLIHC